MSGLPANVRPGSAQADETTPQGVLRVFQHPLNFCFCDEALKLQQAVEIARQQLNSARLQLGEREIALDRTRALLHEHRIGNGAYQIRFVDTVDDQYDDAILAYMHRARFVAARV